MFRPVPVLARVLVLLGLATDCALAENYGFDPAFNGGIPIEDRFAGVNTNSYLGYRIVRLASGDLVSIGLVPAAFQGGGGNIGLVSYSAAGGRIAWSNPSAAYASYFNNYLQYPNAPGIYTAIADARVLGAYIVVEATRNAGGGQLDVDLVVFRNDGTFIGAYPAFNTGLKEIASGLAVYGYFLAPGITARRLIAVATYSVFNPNERQIITVKRFTLANDGTLSVDTSFGPYGNGANDHLFPDSACSAGSNCGGFATSVAVLRDGTNAPTVYIAGLAKYDNATTRPFVMAMDGQSSYLFGNFGQPEHYGIWIQPQSDPAFKIDVAADTQGTYETDRVYYTRGNSGTAGVTRILSQSASGTIVDPVWVNRYLPPTCFQPPCAGGQDDDSFALALTVDGDRVVLAGGAYAPGGAIDPMLAAFDAASAEVLWYRSLPALRFDLSRWGDATLQDLLPIGNGKYAAVGRMNDAGTASLPALFGTFQYAPLGDALFASGYE